MAWVTTRDPNLADFDNVRDSISREELLGLSENERARLIVAWANWWFRSQKFVPVPSYEDPEFPVHWHEALDEAALTRSVSMTGPPQEEEDARQRIRQKYVQYTPCLSVLGS